MMANHSANPNTTLSFLIRHSQGPPAAPIRHRPHREDNCQARHRVGAPRLVRCVGARTDQTDDSSWTREPRGEFGDVWRGVFVGRCLFVVWLTRASARWRRPNRVGCARASERRGCRVRQSGEWLAVDAACADRGTDWWWTRRRRGWLCRRALGRLMGRCTCADATDANIVCT
jgi:hypothetical protein